MGSEVLLNGKASMTDAKLLALMNTWDLALLEGHLSQREVRCTVGPCAAPLEESLGGCLTLKSADPF